MAQLDKLLSHLIAKGASSLRMEPNQQPMIEIPGAGALPLMPNPLPSTMLEMLSKEVLPQAMEEDYLRTGEARFNYVANGQGFKLLIQRTSAGIRMEAAPAGIAGIGATVPASPQSPGVLPTITSPASTPLPVPKPSPSPASGGIALATSPAPSPGPAAPPPPVRHPLPIPANVSLESKSAAAKPGNHPIAEQLFTALLQNKGSDLHCTSFEAPMARIHGDMEFLDGFPVLSSDQLMEMMHAIAPKAAWDRFEEKSDADFAYPFDAGGCRLRVNYFVDRVGPGMVCRVIPNEIPDPDKLGLPDPVKNLADLSKGLVLVTGPTGSGKSTTLAAILDIANRKRSDHILTLEDPIEFVHPMKKCLVNQREIGSHTESFKSGLRAALREDPDIILVGEMRDLETISLALETAITGHLVFGTLHTNSAVSTIDRIVDQFPADRQQQIRVMLADSLKASMSQILLKKLSGGRVAAIETLFVTPAISNLIREGKNFQIPSAMQTGRAYGQKLMNDILLEMIQNKTVDIYEAYMKCPDKESFMATLKRAGITWDPRGE